MIVLYKYHPQRLLTSAFYELENSSIDFRKSLLQFSALQAYKQGNPIVEWKSQTKGLGSEGVGHKFTKETLGSPGIQLDVYLSRQC